MVALTGTATQQALANPVGANVVAGSAGFAQAGSTLTVTNTPGAIINWQSFSIGAGETTRFVQQSAASSVLNRVVGSDPSVLLGTLSSNGRVFLINQSGILVGAGARIDTAGFVASTLNLADRDFLAGKLKFQGTAGVVAAGVQNYGDITTATGGQVYLVGGNVENHGLITAPSGEILLAAGNTVQIGDTSTPGVTIQVAANETATNLGSLVAQSGKIGLVGALVKNAGRINADQVVRGADGKIYLRAKKDVTLEVTSDISVNGADGDGGNITIWSDYSAHLGGAISARGGSNGNGGSIETSALNHLDLGGVIPDASAPNGVAGTWLLDPSDITIVHGSPGVLTGGVFDPASPSVIGDAQINAALNSGTDVTIQTSLGTGGTGTVVINGTADSGGAVAIEYSGPAIRRLTLISAGNMHMHSGASIAVPDFAFQGGTLDVAGIIVVSHNYTLVSGAVVTTGGTSGTGSAGGTISSGGCISTTGSCGTTIIGGTGSVSNNGPLLTGVGTISTLSPSGLFVAGAPDFAKTQRQSMLTAVSASLNPFTTPALPVIGEPKPSVRFENLRARRNPKDRQAGS